MRSLDLNFWKMFYFLQPVLSFDGGCRNVGHFFHFTCLEQQISGDISLEQIGLKESVSFVDNDVDIFVGTNAQLVKYSAYFGERVVGGHDLYGGMTCEILIDLFGLIALSMDT